MPRLESSCLILYWSNFATLRGIEGRHSVLACGARSQCDCCVGAALFQQFVLARCCDWGRVRARGASRDPPRKMCEASPRQVKRRASAPDMRGLRLHRRLQHWQRDRPPTLNLCSPYSDSGYRLNDIETPCRTDTPRGQPHNATLVVKTKAKLQQHMDLPTPVWKTDGKMVTLPLRCLCF